MIIVDPCMIWFHLDCIMQLEYSYYIATNACSRKSVTILLVISLIVEWCRLPSKWLHESENIDALFSENSNEMLNYGLFSELYCWNM